MKDAIVTQNGKELSKKLYTWDNKKKIFKTEESNLVFDFRNIDGVTFYTGDECIFSVGYCCSFYTGKCCSFNAESECFFVTGDCCTFSVDESCTFKTKDYCNFNTNAYCHFNTGRDCTFNVTCECSFITGSECVIIRRGVFEIIKPEEGIKIKLSDYRTKGYRIIKHIEIDGKKIEISLESYEKLKENLV